MPADGPLDAPPPDEALRCGPMPAAVGNVRLGTASWAERTLLESGAFYPRGVGTPERRLRYYARHFPVVEVDSTYYALPALTTAQAWAARTPPEFCFGVKAYAALTGHPCEPRRIDRDLWASLPPAMRSARSVAARALPADVLDALWQRFHQALAPLRAAGKLAYVLFQMPKWFTPTRESHTYLDGLQARVPETRIAVEFRQAGWMAETRRAQTLEFLRRRDLAYVSVDEPQGTPASVPPVAAATTSLAVVRFHGRRGETWDRPGTSTTERFGYLYTAGELREWVPRLRALGRESASVLVLMNNCLRQSAVRNAKELADLLASAGSGSP